MNKTPFGKTGLQVTALGFGGGPIGYLGADQENVTRVLNQLLDAGVNCIDTAAAYKGSEELIGNAISRRRGQFVLVSKCGQKFPDLQGEAWSAAVIGQTIDRSLRLLRTDHLDIMLLHSCDLDTLKKGEAVQALAAARQAGKIHFAGYSGDNEAAIYAATLPDIAVIETSISIADQANIDNLLPHAREKQIGVIAKRPIANAAWKTEDQQSGIYRAYSKPYSQRLAAMDLTPAELGFAGAPDKAWPEIALRFTISQPGVNAAIVGTTNPVRVAENLAYARKGPLPEAVVQKIRDAFHRAQKESGENWPGLT